MSGEYKHGNKKVFNLEMRLPMNQIFVLHQLTFFE